MFKRRAVIYIVTIIVTIICVLMVASPVLAIDEPDSVTLYDITIFSDILETDDILAYVPYEIPFTTLPTPDISKTFIFTMLSPDKSSEIGSVIAYPRYYGGYGKGIVTFYNSDNITWGDAYVFRVQENPVYYPSPQVWDFSIGLSQYSTDADQTQALRAKVIDSASELSIEWSVDLLSTSDAGNTVLSTYGELYYLNAIPGLQTMCPALFTVQLRTPDYTKRSWVYDFAEALRTKWADTFWADFMTGFAGLFSMEESSAMNFISIIIFAIVIFISVWKFKGNMMSAFIDGYDVLLLLMLFGAFSMILAGLMAFISSLLTAKVFFFDKS